MKKLVRYMLIGVCFLLGYGWVEASGQASVDTIVVKKCYGAGDEITSEIVRAKFDTVRESDSSSIVKDKTKDYEVKYRNYQLEFTGDGIANKKTCSDFGSYVCSATSGYSDQIIHCTITYIREIRFKNAPIDEAYYALENAIQEDDLLGTKTNDYPQFSLISKRKWPVVICVKKKLSDNETFVIDGNRCLVDSTTTLNVPERFKDMDCRWESINSNDILSSRTAHKITVTRQKNVLESIVSCKISDRCGSTSKTASIKLLPDKTPESTITVDIPGGDCLSTFTPSFFGPSTVRVTASNSVPGVKFYWVTEEVNVQEDYTTQTFNYPVKGIEDFIIRLATSGGCRESETTKTVHRKLDSRNIDLQISDSYPVTSTSHTHVTIETVPRLPNMSLNWSIPYDFQGGFTNKNRYDQITIYKMSAWKKPINITVINQSCPDGSISKEFIAPTE